MKSLWWPHTTCMAAVTSIQNWHEQHIAFFVPQLLNLSMVRKGSATIRGSSNKFLVMSGKETTTSPKEMTNHSPSILKHVASSTT